jgi:hypothetical protein
MNPSRAIFLTSFPLLLLTACGGTVQVTGSSGSGGATTTTGTTPMTTATSSGTAGTTTSTSTSSSGTTGCTGLVKLVVGSGTELALTADCVSDSWNPDHATTPVGYLLHGGIAPGLSTLNAYGCESAAATSQGIQIMVPSVTAPGTFTDGTVTYTDATGTPWTSTGTVNVAITTLGAVGGVIQGTFSASVTDSPAKPIQTVAGDFTVCRLQDEDAP